MAHLKSITTFYTFIPFLPIISLIKHLSLKVCVEGTCPEVLLITEQKSRQGLTDIKNPLASLWSRDHFSSSWFWTIISMSSKKPYQREVPGIGPMHKLVAKTLGTFQRWHHRTIWCFSEFMVSFWASQVGTGLLRGGRIAAGCARVSSPGQCDTQ